MRRLLGIGLFVALIGATACEDTPSAPDMTRDQAVDELKIAILVAGEAEATAADTRTNVRRWLERVRRALEESDNPEARECLARAESLFREARRAREAGDQEAARALMREAFDNVLCAIVAVFPNAPERTGTAVDAALSRIEVRIQEHLGDRELPERLVRVFDHVRELRARADAIVDENPTEALRLNLRAMHILRRVVHHIRNHRDSEDDQDADDNMSDESRSR